LNPFIIIFFFDRRTGGSGGLDKYIFKISFHPLPYGFFMSSSHQNHIVSAAEDGIKKDAFILPMVAESDINSFKYRAARKGAILAISTANRGISFFFIKKTFFSDNNCNFVALKKGLHGQEHQRLYREKQRAFS
jgi:hypothetical protein